MKFTVIVTARSAMPDAVPFQIPWYRGDNHAEALAALVQAAAKDPGDPTVPEPVRTRVESVRIDITHDEQVSDMSDTSLLVEGANGDAYYIGDLALGMALARKNRHVFYVHTDPEHWSVLFCDSADPDDVAEFGNGVSREQAERYALGALFGPLDAEYDEPALRRALRSEQ